MLSKQMRPTIKRRLFAMLLCLTVGLSSVGLPVVVVWCGVGAEVMESCNRQALVSSPTSCCEQDARTLAGTVEFKTIPCRPAILYVTASNTSSLPPKTSVEYPVLEVLLVMPAIANTGLAGDTEHRVQTDPPPLLHDNIPILTSSLLI